MGGLGDINANKNILLIPETCEKVTAIKHQNGSDFWIVSRAENSNSYYCLRHPGRHFVRIRLAHVIALLCPHYGMGDGLLLESHGR